MPLLRHIQPSSAILRDPSSVIDWLQSVWYTSSRFREKSRAAAETGLDGVVLGRMDIGRAVDHLQAGVV